MILTLLAFAAAGTVRIQIDPDRILNSFVPSQAIGADIDGHDAGQTERIFRSRNVDAMRSAGVRSVSYRLRTELGDEAWHWNPAGKWSDPSRQEGYWTSSASPGAPIRVSYGYRLPRRGNTMDEANNDGYSRLDDGDPSTFWKSNPYLDPAYGERTKSGVPQWVVVDFKKRVTVDTARIRWANPYAIRYRVEYWTGDDVSDPRGGWRTFERGTVENGRGGIETRRLGPARQAQFVRLELLASSHTAEPQARDPRDRMGFAIRELALGTVRNGAFQDAIVHRPDHGQTVMVTSSTDPWHRAVDRDPGTEQPGFDLIYDSGITCFRPVLVPVPVLYDTPENALAELRYLLARRYPVRGIEVGEEPDGQNVDPEAYAHLYVPLAGEFARHNPGLPVGGPSLATPYGTDSAIPPDGTGSWTARFMAELHREGAVHSLGFYSFEWYPCNSRRQTDEELLRRASDRLARTVAALATDGVPRRIPWMITEFGYSAYARPAEDDLPGALLNLDVVGKSLSLGGSAAFAYGYEPGTIISERPGEWGNLMMWLADDQDVARHPLSTYWATRLLTQSWATSDPRPHQLLAADVSDADPSAAPVAQNLSAYALRRPDGTIAVMLLNESETISIPARISLGARGISSGRVVEWGPDEYSWRPTCANGCPVRSLPPTERSFDGQVVLPPFSATVVITTPPLQP